MKPNPTTTPPHLLYAYQLASELGTLSVNYQAAQLEGVKKSGKLWKFIGIVARNQRMNNKFLSDAKLAEEKRDWDVFKKAYVEISRWYGVEERVYMEKIIRLHYLATLHSTANTPLPPEEKP